MGEDPEAARATIVKNLVNSAGLDDPVADYLASMLIEGKVAFNSEAVMTAIGDSLKSYGVAENENDLLKIVNSLCSDLHKAGFSPEVKETEEDIIRRENEALRHKLQQGANVMARWSGDGEFYDAQIKFVLPGDRYIVTFTDYSSEEEVGLADMKLLNRGLRIGDKLSERNAEMKFATDVQLKDLAEVWSDKKQEVFVSQHTIKQQKKEARLKQRAEERMDFEDEQRRIAKEVLKLQVLQIYLQSSGDGGVHSKDVNIPTFNLSPGDGGQDLLENCMLRLVNGRHYGLIGRNGIGKTTLLAAISNFQIKGFPTWLRAIHVEQEVEGSSISVMDTVLQADIERETLMREEVMLQKLIAMPAADRPAVLEAEVRLLLQPPPPPSSDAHLVRGAALAKMRAKTKQQQDEEDQRVRKEMKKYTDLEGRLQWVYQRMRDIDVWSAESRAGQILKGLGFTHDMLQMQTCDLSGGWRMRVALASALFVAPDILCLDEPTNHLDFPAVVWLEDYLCKYPKTLILVSHDRTFLNNVATDIIHLDKKSLTYYKGDYTQFEKTREENMKRQQRAFEAQQRKVAHVQAFIDKFRYNAKRAALVQSRIKQLEKLEVVEGILEDPKFHFQFPEVDVLKQPIALVNDLSFGYSPDRILFSGVNLRLDMDSRVGLVGANGVGKSTLIKLIAGDLRPIDGWVQINGNSRISVFAQHHVDQLNMRMTPVQYFVSMYPDAELNKIRAHLGRYGVVGDLALQRIGTLSGGQKSRVAFAKITWNTPHLLILDEPSNHLDLETVDALIVAINTFEGGVLVVSHDQYLLTSTMNEFWTIDQGRVKYFDSFDAAKKHSFLTTATPAAVVRLPSAPAAKIAAVESKVAAPAPAAAASVVA